MARILARIAWLAVLLAPALAAAQAPDAPRCTLEFDVEIGGRCASDWVLRAFVASLVIIVVGFTWRALTARAGRRDWEVELVAGERRAAGLGDMTPVAAKDPAEAARILQRALGIGAADYARRERHRAFEVGDLPTATAWQKVERLIERQSGAN